MRGSIVHQGQQAIINQHPVRVYQIGKRRLRYTPRVLPAGRLIFDCLLPGVIVEAIRQGANSQI